MVKAFSNSMNVISHSVVQIISDLVSFLFSNLLKQFEQLNFEMICTFDDECFDLNFFTNTEILIDFQFHLIHDAKMRK